MDNECIGDEMRSNVLRKDMAVVPGHSRNKPVNYTNKQMKQVEALAIREGESGSGMK